MDQEDEQCGRMEEIHQQLHTAYQQLPPDEIDFCSGECSGSHELHENEGSRIIQLDNDKDQTNDDNDCRKPLEKIVPVA